MFCQTRNQHNYSNHKSHSLVELGDGHSPLFHQQKALLLQQYSRQQASPLVLDLVKHSPSQQQPQHPCFFRAGKKGQHEGQGQEEGREDDRLDFIKVNSLVAATESGSKEQGLFKPKSFKSNSKVDESRFQSFLQTRLDRRKPGRFSSERGQFS